MGRKLKDLTGQTFGRLTVVDYAGDFKWNVVCECGNTRAVQSSHLASGNTQSCGCIRRETIRKVGKSNRKPAKEVVYDRPKRSVGRPKLPESTYERIVDLYNEGYSYRGIQQCLQVSLRTISRIINENKEKLTREQYTPYENYNRTRGITND